MQFVGIFIQIFLKDWRREKNKKEYTAMKIFSLFSHCNEEERASKPHHQWFEQAVKTQSLCEI